MRKLSQLIVAALIAMATCVSTHAAEWRQFRGPDGQGHADAKNLPATWSETENVRWKTEIPGRGWSSPVFADKSIWMTTAVEQLLTGDELEKAKATLAGNPMAKQLSLVGAVTFRAIQHLTSRSISSRGIST